MRRISGISSVAISALLYIRVVCDRKVSISASWDRVRPAPGVKSSSVGMYNRMRLTGLSEESVDRLSSTIRSAGVGRFSLSLVL